MNSHYREIRRGDSRMNDAGIVRDGRAFDGQATGCDQIFIQVFDASLLKRPGFVLDVGEDELFEDRGVKTKASGEKVLQVTRGGRLANGNADTAVGCGRSETAA